MRVAVLEFLSGGGTIDNAISRSLQHEGMSMLSALANDLVLCGHEVHTCLSNVTILLKASLHGDVQIQELSLSDCNWLSSWESIARTCNRTIVIAPELDHQLERIVERLRAGGSMVVASSKEFLGAASDKLTTAHLLSASNVSHPSTRTLSQFLKTSSNATPLAPMTMKRRDGAGCADMKYFANPVLLNDWLAKQILNGDGWIKGDEWIVQPWLSGRPASMAVIAGDQWHVLGAVEQFIEIAPASLACESSNVSYVGGTGPLKGVTLDQLESLAKKVRQAFPPGAYGWIGIDLLVLNDPSGSQDLVVIEVNPRLTTSYLGYREWYGHKLAQALVADSSSSSLSNHLIATLPMHELTKW